MHTVLIIGPNTEVNHTKKDNTAAMERASLSNQRQQHNEGEIVGGTGSNDQVQLYVSELSIMQQLAKNYRSNLNTSTVSYIQVELDAVLSSFKNKQNAAPIIPAALNLLSELAEISIERYDPSAQLNVSRSLNTTINMILTQLQPEAPVYSLETSTLSLYIVKEYVTSFNGSKTIKVGRNVSIILPGGLATNVLANIPNAGQQLTTLVVSTIVVVTKFHGYTEVRKHAEVDTEWFLNRTYYPFTTGANEIQRAYQEMAQGVFQRPFNVFEQPTQLIEVSFQVSSIEKDATSTQYNIPIAIGKVDSTFRTTFIYDRSNSPTERETSAFVPLCYNPSSQKWSNKGCTVVNVTESNIQVECRHLGQEMLKASSQAISLTVDLLPNFFVLNVSTSKTFSVREASVLLVCVGVFVLTLAGLAFLAFHDRLAIFQAKVTALANIITNSRSSTEWGCINSNFRFLGKVSRKGLTDAGRELGAIFPESATSTETETNAFTILSKKDKEETVFSAYSQSLDEINIYTPTQYC